MTNFAVGRRTFLSHVGRTAVGVATAGSGIVNATRTAMASPSAKRPVIGLIGCGGRSKSLINGFTNEADVAWVCDPDAAHVQQLQAKTGAKRATHDLRHVLDDPAVDGVVIATPDHWHAPAAIMACNADKHVYVEKPCSHNLVEGRLLVEAARRNQVVVQHGTQSRSDPLIAGAIRMLHEGLIGDVLLAKAWNIQRRRNIGHAMPGSPPDGVDYDTWVGPAEDMPFQSNRFHYDWHWWHNFGTGDIGNDGAHELDIARWGLGTTGLPSIASAIGGKYYFDDDQQFPDTATCAFEWPGDGSVGHRRQLIFEMRIWSKNYPYNCDTGIEFHGTKGLMFVSKRGKLQVYDDNNRLLADPAPNSKPDLPVNHQVDFLHAIAEHRKPTADIEQAHESVALIHLANISLRIGRSLAIDPKTRSIINDSAATNLLSRPYRKAGHWSIPDLSAGHSTG